jgi:hypothetical protein
MKKQKVNELTDLIALLDSSLMNGYIIYDRLIQDFPMSKRVLPYSEENALEDLGNIISPWKMAVISLLESKLRRKHYLVSFLHVNKPAGVSKPGFSEKVSNVLLTLQYRLYVLETIIKRLEDQNNLNLRKEISEREYQAGIAYKITYSEHSRDIKLNNIVLCSPDFESENDRFFYFVYANPNRIIPMEELHKGMGGKPNKTISQILRDLKFKGDLKKLFFPVSNNKNVQFINPISKAYLMSEELPNLNFGKLFKVSENE